MIDPLEPGAPKRPTLLILAAGAGSRYGGLKQLAPIGPSGETLLEYSAFDAAEAGFDRAVLVLRPEDEVEFRRRLDPGMGRRLALTYVHQTLDLLPVGSTLPPGRTRPWGTGQAVLVARDSIPGPFTVLNADDYYGSRPFEELRGFFQRPDPRSLPTLAVVAYEVGATLTDAGPVSRALCRVDDRDRLLDIVELKRVWREEEAIFGLGAEGETIELAEEDRVSMNMWGLDPGLFPELRRRFRQFLSRHGQDPEAEYLLPDVVSALCREGRVEVRVLPGARTWCGITYREDLLRAEETIAGLVAAGKYPKELWS